MASRFQMSRDIQILAAWSTKFCTVWANISGMIKEKLAEIIINIKDWTL
jgi:hypothetical protein